MNSFRYALCGIKTAWKTEENLKIHFFIMLMVIVAGVTLKINTTEWSVVLILCGLVISLELINTAIENAVDLVTKEYNEKAKNAKDIAAGAVLFSAIIAAIIGFIIFLPKIINII
ncbi:MAG: diacylglycerol kinase family protein [Clostridia bacterium]